MTSGFVKIANRWLHRQVKGKGISLLELFCEELAMAIELAGVEHDD